MTGQRPAWAALDRFVAPVRVRPTLWRFLAGLVLAVALSVALTALAGVAIWLRYGAFIGAGMLYAITAGATPGALVALLFGFGGLLLGTFAAARLVQGRPAGTLFGAPFAVLLPQFVRAALAVVAVQGTISAIPLVTGEAVAHRHPLDLLPFYPFAAVGLLVQVVAEETLFRGYILQGLAARYRQTWIWFLLPAVMFAAGHYQPGKYGDAALIVVVWAGMFGLFAADLTARTGNLGAAAGFHFASNGVALFFMGTAGDLDGMSAFVTPGGGASLAADLPGMVVIFVATVASWLAVRFALRV
jgi:membrane protease YdiL (CAAX protease family)